MFPFTQSSSCKVRANPIFVVDLEFEDSRLRVKIATGAKETSPGIELKSLALQADSLPIELAGPGGGHTLCLLICDVCFPSFSTNLIFKVTGL